MTAVGTGDVVGICAKESSCTYCTGVCASGVPLEMCTCVTSASAALEELILDQTRVSDYVLEFLSGGCFSDIDDARITKAGVRKAAAAFAKRGSEPDIRSEL